MLVEVTDPAENEGEGTWALLFNGRNVGLPPSLVLLGSF